MWGTHVGPPGPPAAPPRETPPAGRWGPSQRGTESAGSAHSTPGPLGALEPPTPVTCTKQQAARPWPLDSSERRTRGLTSCGLEGAAVPRPPGVARSLGFGSALRPPRAAASPPGQVGTVPPRSRLAACLSQRGAACRVPAPGLKSAVKVTVGKRVTARGSAGRGHGRVTIPALFTHRELAQRAGPHRIPLPGPRGKEGRLATDEGSPVRRGRPGLQ